WTFYEIDPVVERFASNPRYFPFLSRSPAAPITVETGDARLELAKDRGRAYALLVLDAFSSDAIPMHLITREAVALYRERLTDDGLIAIHISNRHLALGPVIARLAAD